jgi:hypothetical protein
LDFFDSPDVAELAQNHAEEILGLEDSESKRVIKAYRRVRQDLRDRLDTLPAGSFSAQRTRAALVQIDGALVAMKEGVLTEMDSSAQDSAEMGLGHLTRELKKWDKKFLGAITPINLNVVKVATDTKKYLFNQYDSSLDAYNSQLRGEFARQLMDAAIAGDPMSAVIQRISQIFLGEEWKIERLVRTELHNIYSMGKLNGMVDLADGELPDLKKTLYHPMDKRTGKDTIRLSRNNPIVPVDEPFKENSTGKWKTYMAPPNRPNDRAILIPYRDSWGK